MKKTILLTSVAVLVVGGLAAVARQRKDEQADPNLPYQFRQKCTAYVERNPDRTSPYKKYYIGECVFQFNFHANTDEPVNIIPLYNTYAESARLYPAFNPDKCTMNLKKEKFNFSRWHPQWHKIPNNEIKVEKVKDDDGHEFSFTADINSEYSDGTAKHIVTAEIVCIGPRKLDVQKHLEKQQAKADKTD